MGVPPVIIHFYMGLSSFGFGPNSGETLPAKPGELFQHGGASMRLAPLG